MLRTRRKRTFWSANDIKRLRSMAGRQRAALIAKTLKRTLLAVRYKAHIHGISLAFKRAR